VHADQFLDQGCLKAMLNRRKAALGLCGIALSECSRKRCFELEWRKPLRLHDHTTTGVSRRMHYERLTTHYAPTAD
jgi:hypothetical protein